jgi:hypothetical protein
MPPSQFRCRVAAAPPQRRGSRPAPPPPVPQSSLPNYSLLLRRPLAGQAPPLRAGKASRPKRCSWYWRSLPALVAARRQQQTRGSEERGRVKIQHAAIEEDTSQRRIEPTQHPAPSTQHQQHTATSTQHSAQHSTAYLLVDHQSLRLGQHIVIPHP